MRSRILLTLALAAVAACESSPTGPTPGAAVRKITCEVEGETRVVDGQVQTCRGGGWTGGG